MYVVIVRDITVNPQCPQHSHKRSRASSTPALTIRPTVHATGAWHSNVKYNLLGDPHHIEPDRKIADCLLTTPHLYPHSYHQLPKRLINQPFRPPQEQTRRTILALPACSYACEEKKLGTAAQSLSASCEGICFLGHW